MLLAVKSVPQRVRVRVSWRRRCDNRGLSLNLCVLSSKSICILHSREKRKNNFWFSPPLDEKKKNFVSVAS